jgi:hypothetical protein
MGNLYVAQSLISLYDAKNCISDEICAQFTMELCADPSVCLRALCGSCFAVDLSGEFALLRVSI